MKEQANKNSRKEEPSALLDRALEHLVPTSAMIEDWEWSVSETPTVGLETDSIPGCANSSSGLIIQLASALVSSSVEERLG